MTLTPFQRRVLADVAGVVRLTDGEQVFTAVEKVLTCETAPSGGHVEILELDWVGERRLVVRRKSTPKTDDLVAAAGIYGEGFLVSVADVMLYCPEIDPMSPDSPVV